MGVAVFRLGTNELNRAFRVYLNLVHEFTCTAVERSCGGPCMGTTKFNKFSTAVVELY
eukprot:SAG11_NODE_1956_length_4002_cov_5.858827_1_plen_58_part_00